MQQQSYITDMVTAPATQQLVAITTDINSEASGSKKNGSFFTCRCEVR